MAKITINDETVEKARAELRKAFIAAEEGTVVEDTASGVLYHVLAALDCDFQKE